MEGVREAQFSYGRAEGFVTFETTKTSPEEFLAELDRMTDFSGTVRTDANAESMPHDTPEGSEEHTEGSHEHSEAEQHRHETGNDGTR